MDVSALLIFALALAVTAGSPGPSLAALVARVLVRGWREVLPFLAAMWLGEALWLACALFGLAALAQSFHTGFLALKYAGVAYLLYLAWRMWRADPADPNPEEAPEGGAGRLFLAGLAVTLGNPKIMVFYLALLPSLVSVEDTGFSGWALLTLTMFLVLATVDLAYVVLAEKLRKIFTSPRVMKLVNRGAAGVMGLAALAIAGRQ